VGEALELVKSLVGWGSQRVDYVPHDINDVMVMVGVPPIRVRGLEYVMAQRSVSPQKLHMCLTGNGTFTRNTNQSGIIEIAVLAKTLSVTMLELINIGIAWPIAITDTGTAGLSTVLADKAMRVATPEWRKGKFPGLDIFTFATPRLIISHGTQLPQLAQ
jgi:hypothetical protein